MDTNISLILAKKLELQRRVISDYADKHCVTTTEAGMILYKNGFFQEFGDFVDQWYGQLALEYYAHLPEEWKVMYVRWWIEFLFRQYLR